MLFEMSYVELLDSVRLSNLILSTETRTLCASHTSVETGLEYLAVSSL